MLHTEVFEDIKNLSREQKYGNLRWDTLIPEIEEKIYTLEDEAYESGYKMGHMKGFQRCMDAIRNLINNRSVLLLLEGDKK